MNLPLISINHDGLALGTPKPGVFSLTTNLLLALWPDATACRHGSSWLGCPGTNLSSSLAEWYYKVGIAGAPLAGPP